MGTQGTEKDARGDLVFDAGALIAFERGDPLVRALAAQAAESQLTLVIPASVLAQVWRGGPRSASLAHLIAGGESDSLDEARAKEAGERLGVHAATDIADAHVVCCALEQEATLVTSDAEDMNALAGPGEKLALLAV